MNLLRNTGIQILVSLAIGFVVTLISSWLLKTDVIAFGFIAAGITYRVMFYFGNRKKKRPIEKKYNDEVIDDL